MAKFIFRFEAALEARRIDERKAQEAMAPLVAQYNELQAQAQRLEEGLQRYEARRLDYLTRADLIQIYAQGMEHGRASRAHLESEKARLDGELEGFRQKLREAIGRRKALEILRDAALAEFRKAELRREDQEISEIATSRRLHLPF